jgi:hypothetical protein
MSSHQRVWMASRGPSRAGLSRGKLGKVLKDGEMVARGLVAQVGQKDDPTSRTPDAIPCGTRQMKVTE